MNPYLSHELADAHIHDLRRAAAQHAAARAAGHRPRGGGRYLHPALLRHQIGFTLIEAGLRLVGGAAEPAGLHTSS